MVKTLPAMQEMKETQVRSMGWEDPLEEEFFPIFHWEIHRQKSLSGCSPWSHNSWPRLSMHGFLYVRYKSLIKYMVYKCFHPFSGLSFHFLNSVKYKTSLFWYTIYLLFPLPLMLFCIISKKTLPNPNIYSYFLLLWFYTFNSFI